MNLQISEWIQIVSILSTVLISLVSIWQSRKAIKLTEQSIEDANKPYLAISYETVNMTPVVITYIILKNYGNTGAYVQEVTASPAINTQSTLKFENNPFEKLKNHFIAPGQSLKASVFVNSGTESEMVDSRTFTLTYTDSKNKKTIETFTFDETSTDIIQTLKLGASKSDTVASVLLKSSQELFRHML